MARSVLEFNDFGGGDYGSLEAWRAPKNSFSATNLLVYRSGELGVRPGLRDVTPTNAAGDVGCIGGMLENSFTVSYVWYKNGTAVQRFQPSVIPATTVSTASGAFTGASSSSFAVPSGEVYYIVTDSEGVYRYDPPGNALTTLAAARDGRSVAQYGDRLMVGGPVTNVLYYSAPDNFTDFVGATAGTILVGDSEDPITALLPQRNHLLIFKGSGGIYLLTGVPGVNETLRQVTRHLGVQNQDAVGRSINERVWFHNVKSVFPSSFDGAQVKDWDRIELPNVGGNGVTAIGQFRSEDMDGIVIYTQPFAAFQVGVNSAPLWIRSRGIWTKHSFGATINADIESDNGYGDTVEVFFASAEAHALARITPTFTWYATPSGGIAFYSLSPLMDRPGTEYQIDGSAPERAGDLSSAQVSGSVTFPEWHAEAGQEVRVRDVIVDFRKWKTGGSLTNHFDLTVSALRTYDAGTVDSQTLEWDEPDTYGGATGTLERKTFSFGDQGVGNGFQISFENMRGIAIQRYFVVLETFPVRV